MAEPSEEQQQKLSRPESPVDGSPVVAANAAATVQTNVSSPTESESGDPLLDSVTTDCLGLSVGYERLPRARSHTTDDEDDHRSIDSDRPPSERRSPKPPQQQQHHHHNIFGRLFDHKPRKAADSNKTPKKGAAVDGEKPKKGDAADGDKTPKKVEATDGEKPKTVDCAVQTEDDSDEMNSTKDDKKKKKKRSSWLPDPGKRWPVQGFS